MSTARLASIWKGAWPAISLCLLLALVVLATAGGSQVLQRHITEMLVNVVLVVGLYVFAGNSGVLSFGQMSFMAIGAYTTAIITIPVIQKQFLLPDLPTFLANAHFSGLAAVLIAGLVAAVVAAIIAAPICRLSGLASSLAMFAVLVIVHEVARNWDAVTRGSRTMIGVPTTIGVNQALPWAMAAIVGVWIYQRSRFGLRLRATREDEFAARSVGISIARERAYAFVLSGFVIGVGGYLYAQYQGAFTPDAFFTHVTFLTIAMLVIGGTKSLSGATVGAVVVSLLTDFLDSLEGGATLGPVHFAGRDGLSDAALAIFIIVVLTLRPLGITGGREIEWRLPARWSRGRRDGGDAAAEVATEVDRGG
jgi:branched-chain amino acid transport system permease protein